MSTPGDRISTALSAMTGRQLLSRIPKIGYRPKCRILGKVVSQNECFPGNPILAMRKYAWPSVTHEHAPEIQPTGVAQDLVGALQPTPQSPADRRGSDPFGSDSRNSLPWPAALLDELPVHEDDLPDEVEP